MKNLKLQVHQTGGRKEVAGYEQRNRDLPQWYLKVSRGEGRGVRKFGEDKKDLSHYLDFVQCRRSGEFAQR